MAIIVTTDTPQTLLALIKKEIDGEKIATWAYDSDGDFSHTAEQWHRRAWLRPRTEPSRLIFNIFPPRDQTLKRVVYGIYHGRFIEMLLNHFDEKFTRVEATAMGASPDRISG